MKLKPILQDKSDFRFLREGGFVYVDKTDFFHKMITADSPTQLFISRPRRFGKSLMISTLAEIFAGNRELFKGLKIDSLEWDWKPHTVFRFSFGAVETKDFATFEKTFAEAVRDGLNRAGAGYAYDSTPGTNFEDALDAAKDPVVLIDEYDAPVGHALGDPDLAEKIRAAMADFYIHLKERATGIRFLLVTGVSKLAKLSVFSALNNIVDISLKPGYAAMLGYTEDELDEYFGGHMKEHARVMGMEYGEYRRALKEKYDGFRFSAFSEATTYSPISLALAFGEMLPVFRDYWSATGRASMLMNVLKREEVAGFDVNGMVKAYETDFDVVDFRDLQPVSLLFQTGYLTVKDYDRYSDRYILGVPNSEVRRDLAQVLVNAVARKPGGWALRVGGHLIDGEWEEFFEGVNSLYAALPPMKGRLSRQEVVYQRELMLILAAQGFEVRGEVVQSEGRADVVMESERAVYVFELKVDGSAEEAVKQIEEKGYAEPYVAGGKDIWLVGMSFSSEARRVVGWDVRRRGR